MMKEKTANGADSVFARTRKIILDNRLIAPGERVLIGLSGGVDSMVLTECLLQLAKEIGFDVGCAHLHHGLRGEDADADLEFVSDYCRKRDIAFFERKADIKAIAEENRISTESAGREVRYAFFDDVMKTYGYDKLALAHHADDQAETVLMRLARGTGIKGASGMRLCTDQTIRPLLGLSRREIEVFAVKREIAFRQDASNEDRTYSRNFIRHDIMAPLEKRYPGAGAHIAAFAEDAALYEAFFQKEVERRKANFCLIDTHQAYPVKSLLSEEIVMRAAIVRRLIAGQADMTDIHRVHVEKILSALNQGKTTWTLSLPRNIVVERRYEWLLCYQKTAETIKPYLASRSFSPQKNVLYVDAAGKQALTVLVNRKQGLKKYNNCKNNDEIILGYGKINHKPIIRHRMPGDRLTLSDGKRQKLKDFLINRKIPSAVRKHLFIISDEETIRWIPGLFHLIDRESVTASENTICIKWEQFNDQ